MKQTVHIGHRTNKTHSLPDTIKNGWIMCTCAIITISKLTTAIYETESRSVKAITGVLHGALEKYNVRTDVQMSQVIHPSMMILETTVLTKWGEKNLRVN